MVQSAVTVTKVRPRTFNRRPYQRISEGILITKASPIEHTRDFAERGDALQKRLMTSRVPICVLVRLPDYDGAPEDHDFRDWLRAEIAHEAQRLQ